MDINQLVTMAKTIHDVEGYNLGASSTRDYRNAFWARAIGCAYWGHPTYNKNPDTQWNLKKAGQGSPQSDDVATSLPSRSAWDCIPGAGADGYHFEADYIGILPPEQVVYAPPKPDSGGAVIPPPATSYPYPDEPTTIMAYQNRVKATYAEAGRIFPDPNDSDAFRWFTRYGYRCKTEPEPQVANAVIAELRAGLGLS